MHAPLVSQSAKEAAEVAEVGGSGGEGRVVKEKKRETRASWHERGMRRRDERDGGEKAGH